MDTATLNVSNSYTLDPTTASATATCV